MEDIKAHRNGVFVTLTFSNQQYTALVKEILTKTQEGEEGLTGYYLDNAVATMAVHRFRERWRKEYKKSIRHWLVTEIGHNGTENIHLHGILWTDKPTEIARVWQYGWVWPGKDEIKNNYVNERTINYIVKYVTKQDPKHKLYKPVILTSPGIGGNYINTHNSTLNTYVPGNTNEIYTTRQGTKSSLPIYFRNKIYTEEQREKLWIEKIEKGKRYVLGTEIDIRNSLEMYNKAIEWAQKYNKEMGYGNGTTTWDRAQYEMQLRQLKQKQRMSDPIIDDIMKLNTELSDKVRLFIEE